MLAVYEDKVIEIISSETIRGDYTPLAVKSLSDEFKKGLQLTCWNTDKELNQQNISYPDVK